LKNSSATVVNNATGAPLAVGTTYSYTEPGSHKVAVAITLTPSIYDFSVPEGTYYLNCTGFYLTLQFNINDNNNLYRTSRFDPTIQPAETAWQTITVHVIAVDDSSFKMFSLCFILLK